MLRMDPLLWNGQFFEISKCLMLSILILFLIELKWYPLLVRTELVEINPDAAREMNVEDQEKA